MARTILAVVAGMLVAMATMKLFEFGSARLHPFPPGADPRDMAAWAAHVADAPFAALAPVVAGWTVAAFDGGLVAALISRRHRRGAALVVGALIVCGVIAVNAMFAHPLWMLIAGLLLPLPASGLGARCVARGPKDP
ncbi:hypothetical protein [Lysobacter firmicutimachus]|uniref:DoxX family protein n=1 Tax=Lysobacter firmicutimachus TaxID=1792846 RepID=A0ABU8D005_9GAMM